MFHAPVTRAFWLVVLGITSLGANPARAALGGDAASVLADGAELHGSVYAATLPLYDLQEITADSGMHVRQYLNRDGVVFAVSWTGPVPPNLQHLLGAHYAAYTAALAALNHPGLHRSVRVASADLVVESGGHLRAYGGRAYLPLAVPAGVPTAELR
ncbi:MAG TPA: DUF2844 domain-containing protein [Steroidobacteraceae bacterium]|nr:DUF2844 domain-containing protein [Steroidobacteraceae bacterium]